MKCIACNKLDKGNRKIVVDFSPSLLYWCKWCGALFGDRVINRPVQWMSPEDYNKEEGL